jgi:coenzyme F420-reducing hydrogenase alpha subunit
VFRLRVTLDGEVITDVEPIFGYLHRGTEKLAEERTYTQVVTLTDRLDYTSSMINNQAYVMAVEKLAGAEVPERGQYLRALTAEAGYELRERAALYPEFAAAGGWAPPAVEPRLRELTDADGYVKQELQE